MNDNAPLVLERYRIEMTLGKGAFGTTWAATDMRSGSSVAVKALDLSRIDDWKAVELFEREAQTLEQLDHPNIPQYLDFVPVRDSETGYLVQSLAPGEPLSRILERQGRLTNEQVDGVAEKTLEILIYLESLNPPVVHRDLKPANLLLDEAGEVYLVDFGAVQDAAKRTTEGGSTVAGTFGYMAPEQLHGVASPRSDLYSLGMTLIHLASGHHPSELNRSGLKVVFRDRIDLSKSMETFIDRLVEPNPDDRFPSAREALAHLRDEVEVAPNLSELPRGSSSIADTVLAREKEARAAERAAERARLRDIEARGRKIAKRRDRVSVKMNEDEVLIAIEPQRLWKGLIGAGPALFIFGNPGFVLAGGFPFLGPHWPVFANYWPGRWALWGLTMFLAWALWLWLTTPTRHIHLSREGFYTAYHRRASNPDQAGRFHTFGVETFAHDDGYPGEHIELRLEDEDGHRIFEQRFENLSKRDVDLLDDLPSDWIEGRDSSDENQPGPETAVFDFGDGISGTSTTSSEDVEAARAHADD